MFSPLEKRQILQYARQILEDEFAAADSAVPPAIARLQQNGCCFVTLWEAGEIRGCIGSSEPFEPLAQNLVRNTLNAAFSDPGFPPLEPDELAEIRLEITIPGKLEAVTMACASPDTDGMLLRNGSRRALFLPQVVRQQGWDKETALRFLRRKAGLPEESDQQNSDVELLCFPVETFQE